MKLTIVGLGPGHADDLTRRAWNLLQNAPEVYLRTARHPVVDALPQTHQSFDALYDAAEDFETLYATITARVIELARRPDGVIYAVPGHPLVGEQTVTRLIARAGGTLDSSRDHRRPQLHRTLAGNGRRGWHGRLAAP